MTDHLAENEQHALSLARGILSTLNQPSHPAAAAPWARPQQGEAAASGGAAAGGLPRSSRTAWEEPRYSPDELRGEIHSFLWLTHRPWPMALPGAYPAAPLAYRAANSWLCTTGEPCCLCSAACLLRLPPPSSSPCIFHATVTLHTLCSEFIMPPRLSWHKPVPALPPAWPRRSHPCGPQAAL